MCRLLMSTWQCLCGVIWICKEPSVLVFLTVLVLKDFTKDRDGSDSVQRDGYCYVSSKGWCALPVLVLVFRLFQKPENRQFRFFEQKSESKELLVPVISKTWKGLAVFMKESAMYGQRLYVRLFEKKFPTKFENHGYIQDSGPWFLRVTLPMPKNRSDNLQGYFPVSNKHQTLLVYLLYSTFELHQEINPRPRVFRDGVSSCKSLGNKYFSWPGF